MLILSAILAQVLSLYSTNTCEQSVALQLDPHESAQALSTTAGQDIDNECVKNGVTIGQCGTNARFLPACDASWNAACAAGGGTITTCAGSACDTHDVTCDDDDSLYHACDEAFIIACGNTKNGKFECTAQTCCPENCTDGKCKNVD